MKQILTEKDISNIIKKTVRQVLAENEMEEGLTGKLWGAAKGIYNAIGGETNKTTHDDSLGSRYRQNKHFIKQSMWQSDRAQDLRKLQDLLYKMELDHVFNKKTYPKANELYNAIDKQLSNEMGQVKGSYKSIYGNKYPEKEYSDVRCGGGGGVRPTYITGGFGTGV